MTHTVSSNYADISKALHAELAAHPKILVVCTGNICRSPMGEVVLGAKLARAGIADYAVASCGVSSEESGSPIYPPAARALRAAGYDVPMRAAHRATDSELAQSGLILAMTVGHARSLRSRCEQAGVPVRRIHLWREFDGTGLDPAPEGCFGPGGALADNEPVTSSTRRNYSDFYTSDGEWDVDDPWYSGNFHSTMATIEAGAEGIVTALRVR